LTSVEPHRPRDPRPPRHLTVLGGGITGLAAGYYAWGHGLPATVYEAHRLPGGLSVTFAHDAFLFDSGAHRFHDKDPAITQDVRAVLGDDLRAVSRPSVIYDGGHLLPFPFRLPDVLRHLGPGELARGVLDLAAVRMAGRAPEPESFAGLATRRYGRAIAARFLLGYSHKLWGVPGERLSARASGGRLQGLDLRQFLRDTLLGRSADRRSVDGSFYYPTRGIGMLAEALARGCRPQGVRTSTEVRRLHHDGARIRSIAVPGVGDRIPVDTLASTLPIERLLAIMDPPPPARILQLARDLKHRHLVLVALFLRKASVTGAATVYFPDPGVPFTRVTEPRNRSEAMSPAGHTSLVAEIPCGPEDSLWSADDAHLVGITLKPLEQIGWIRGGELVGSRVVRLRHAYPVLALGYERSLEPVLRYLDGFGNLALAGRNGRFEYGWIHGMLRSGRDLVASCVEGSLRPESGVA
jgi:protoporphyrinogen oxidase